MTVETRLKKVESLLGLGLGTEVTDLGEQVKRLTSQVSQLRNEKEIGNVLGGMIRTDIGPGILPVGPYRQDVDASFSLEFTLWIPAEVLRIRRMTLHLTPKPSRLAAGVSEASEDTVEVESSGHVHLWAAKVGGAINSGVAVPQSTSISSANALAGDGTHTHIETGGTTFGPSATINAALSTHNHGGATHSVLPVSALTQWIGHDSTGASSSTRTFDMAMVSGHSSDIYTAISAQTPTSVSTPDHTHDIELSISEHGMADDLEIIIDGVNRTSALGGPWTSEADISLDLNDLILVGFINARQEPVTGAHTIEVTSSAEGAVEVVGDYYVVIKGVQ